ncbi:phage portal protein [Sulfitobacter alexandrii]|uniref:Phage portal protein n=1 Tax=Sulfitobacter alexandrii TaxID=1917485 RepID=A0A1J0WGZ9_9RHOB|nr:phage portal protein [Sulfitobacter alexandrii]APE43406.1 phage portal protein [Sulfitobacter alexandrii]
MGLLNWLAGPRNAVQEQGGGRTISASADLEEAVRHASLGNSAGIAVTTTSAMRVAAVYGCVRLISGAVANLPIHVKQRIDEDTRIERPDHPLSAVLRRRPNGWQTPSQFKRMMQAHLLLRGNGYAQIVWSRGRVIALNPLNPDRMKVTQADDLSLRYEYQRRDGVRQVLPADTVMHLVGLTLDGVTGVSVLTYAREAIGLSIAQDRHGATTFRNGARPSSVLTHPEQLSKEAQENLRASLDAYRSGGESEGKALILEEGMTVADMSMTSTDAQWIESRKFSRGDIAMFFGVPPHMIGDTDKTSSWGTGVEHQSIGFVTYTLEDHLTTWEETANRDLLKDEEPSLYSRFNRKALVRGDIKTRTDHYTKMLQWGVYSPNEVRRLEDSNPREGGDVFYDPPNTAGARKSDEGDDDDNPNTA